MRPPCRLQNTLLLTAAALMTGCGGPVPGSDASPIDLPQVVTEADGALPAALRLGNQRALLHTPTGVTALRPVDEAQLEGLAGLPQRRAGYVVDGGEAILVTDGHLRARFADDLPLDAMRERARLAGAELTRVVRPAEGIVELRVDDPERAVTVARRLHESGWALWAQPVFWRQARMGYVPNDAMVGAAWHLQNISAEAAWDRTRGASGVRIAIIDSGVDNSHPDLASKQLVPRDSIYGIGDADADNSSPHGTACAGLAAAVTDNGVGVAGVCPNCSIIPIRILSEADSFMSDATVTDAFYWATDHGAAVLSNSWGFTPDVAVPYSIEEAISYATTEGRDGLGAIVLFASGNEGRVVQGHELAALDDVLTIGATDSNDRRFDYSNTGAVLALTAPAGSVTTDLQGTPGYSNNAYTDSFGGTSASTPVTAGVAALVLSAAPGLTRDQLFTALMASADRPGGTQYVNGRNDLYGAGRVNADAALAMVDTGIGRACDSDADCGPAGLCATAALPSIGRACTFGCVSTSDCPSGLRCDVIDDTTGAGACLKPCGLRGDCGEAQSCWPQSGTSGSCWLACTSDADCGDDSCNPHGLCGEERPPALMSIAPSCSCDITTACDATCACDVDCPAVITGSVSCSSARPGLIFMLLLPWALRRRRASGRRAPTAARAD